MKKFLLFFLMTAVLTQTLLAQEKEAPKGDEDSSIGLEAGIDYYSLYLFRGLYFFGGDGAFLPYAIYDIAKSGVKATVLGEISESYIGEGKNDRNHTAFINHGVDFCLSYEHVFKKDKEDFLSLGFEAWYYWYFNLKDATGFNGDYFTGKVTATLLAFSITPFAAVSYDYYLDKDYVEKQGEDFYVQLGAKYEKKLAEAALVNFSLWGGYYNARSIHKTGFSDVSAAVGFELTHGAVTLKSSFNYVLVPDKEFYRGEDINRFFATFGASYSI